MKRTKGVRAVEASGGYQEAMILVKGGYTPDTIFVRHGKPVRLNFRREETASCSDKVIFADFAKSADLPTGEHGGQSNSCPRSPASTSSPARWACSAAS